MLHQEASNLIVKEKQSIKALYLNFR